MDRRTFLALLSAPAIAALLEACGSSDDEGSSTVTTSPPTGPGPSSAVARSNAARVATTVDDAAAATAALNAFGADLYGRLAAGQVGRNLVFSPASIAVALTMTRAGAVGATATEMDGVLHIADPAAIDHSMNALTAALEARSGTFTADDGSKLDVLLAIANSLWGQHDVTFEPAFLDRLASEYGAGMNLVDFRHDAEGARTRINAWVDEETKDRIPELIGPGVLDALTRLVLVNAVYLKAPWLHPFTETGTTKEPFTRADGSTVQADMMTLSEFLPYAKGDGWQAVVLPYIGEQLEMVVVVPDIGELATVESALPSGLLGEVASAARGTPVNLGFPKFDIETKAMLSELLQAMGMRTAFSDAADFSGMTKEVPLQISEVVHQANITVDEKGTEAAAATAVVMRATGAPIEPIELTVDRPFLYALRDAQTGAVLFLGRVSDPTAPKR